MSTLAPILDAIGIIISTVWIYLVPDTFSDVTLVHVAIYTPAIVGMLAGTWRMLQRSPSAPAQPAPVVNAPAPKLNHRQRYAQIKRIAVDKRLLQEEEERARKAAAQAVADAAHADRVAAERAQREQARQKAREEAKAQKVAHLAAERAQREQARQKAREEAKAQKVAHLAAERAQREQARQKAREEAKAQKVAQLAAEQSDRAERRRQAREEAKAQRAAERATRPPRPRPTGDPVTRAFGADPSRIYEFRYRVISLDELITSNTDSGSINPEYDRALQPRQRDRAASRRQVEHAAKNLVPEALIWDFKALDKGAPIIGSDRQVESGNGRTMALRRARMEHADKWAAYQETLRANLLAVGLSESDLAGVESPVLVRERITDVADRTAFAREANAPPVLQMSTLETAAVDANRITADLIARLNVREGQSIDQALRTKANADFVRGFIGTMSENESALLLRKDGTLAQSGIRRIKAAMFVRTFEGDSGERLAETFLEALDNDIKNFETGLSASLPVLSRAEYLVATGQRAADLSMADDISRSLDMLARLREADGLTVEEYVGQSALFERETTAFQDELLVYFDEIGRSPKKIREFFGSYASAVEDAPHPDQRDLFGESISPSKEQLFARITGRKLVTV